MTPAPSKNHRRSAFIASLLVVLGFIALVFFVQTDFDRRSFLGFCIQKHRLLHEAGSPKIVLVGGFECVNWN